MINYIYLLVGLTIGFILGFSIPVISEKLKRKEKDRELFFDPIPLEALSDLIEVGILPKATDEELHRGTDVNKPMSPKVLSDLMRRITKEDEEEDVIVRDSRDIKFENYEGLNGPCFICLAKDEECDYIAECTNHDSAGDRRAVHGVLPDIYYLDEENFICRCLLADNAALPKYGMIMLTEHIRADLNK